MRSTIVFTVLAALLFAENAAANSIVWNISATTSKSNKKILSEVLGTSESGRLHALLGKAVYLPAYCTSVVLFNSSTNTTIIHFVTIHVSIVIIESFHY